MTWPDPAATDDDPTDVRIAEMLADAILAPYPGDEPPPDVPLLAEREDHSVDLNTISTDPPAPLLIERLDPIGHTILYGTGGVGKGALGSAWVAALVREGRRVLILDYERHPEEWARRIASLAPDVMDLGAIRYMSPAEPLLRGTGDVIAACELNGSDYLVVDSAVMACATDPLKPETPMAYTAALLTVARPTLTLAHVTKTDDARYPFGSVFWHNLARMTWSLTGDEKETLLRNRKRSNYRNQGTFSLRMNWSDEGLLTSIDERGFQMRILDRAMDALNSGPLSLTELLERVNDGEMQDVDRESLRKAMSRAVNSLAPMVLMSNGIYSRV